MVKREIFERGHAVGVLPYDPVQKEFVFVQMIEMLMIYLILDWIGLLNKQ